MKTKYIPLLIGLMSLALPTLVQAQYDYTDNGDGTCAITAYTGSGGDVVIPGMINDLTVTSIGFQSFAVGNISSVTIPNSVINIGNDAFDYTFSLTNIMVDASNPTYSSLNGVLFDKAQTTLIQFPDGLGGGYAVPNSVTNIMLHAFRDNSSLTSVTIPNSVTSIGNYAFAFTGLTNVNIGNGLASLGNGVFLGCSSLTSAYFQGNTPPDDGTAFYYDPATVYYLLGTSGWGSTFGGVPTVLWNPQADPFGVTGGHFGFNLTGPTNAVIVVQACTNLSNPVWSPVATNSFSSSGTSAFSDLQWTNFPKRFYRFRSP